MVDTLAVPGTTVLPSRTDVETLLRLAIPVIIVQVGMMAMGVVDTLMIGRVSPAALAAVGLGNLYFFAVAMAASGVLMALDPIVAQAVGAHDTHAVSRAFQRGIVLVAILTVPVSLLHTVAGPILAFARQPMDVVPLAAEYSWIMIPGIVPFLLFIVFRQTLQAMGQLRPVVIVILASNAINVVLNWALIFGHLGFAPMGVQGSAWATSLSRWSMGIGLMVLAWPTLRPLVRPWLPESHARAPLWRMVRLGLPISAQFLLEFGAFGAIALLMGWLGTVAVAGHQVAMNLASLTFMVPFGLGAAVSVVVGQAVGRNDPDGVRGASVAGLVCGVGFMSVTCLVFLMFPWELARLYTPDPAVLAVAGVLLPLAGLFQVFDGIQVVAIGILRGLGDTRTPFVVNIFGFWLIGIPVSVALGFRWEGGPGGLWLGLVVGLMIVALVLLARVRTRLRMTHVRLEIDAAMPHPTRESPAL